MPEYYSDSFMDFVRHPTARRYVIRVRPDGSVRVTVPRWGSRRYAALFSEQQQAWIERQRAQISESRADRAGHTPEAVTAFRRQAARELPERLRCLAAHHGLTVSRISVRNQRSRWGSCSPSGYICLNWRLVLMPGTERDYGLIPVLEHVLPFAH